MVVGSVVALGAVAFLLFRPDTLFTEVEADESLDEAFTSTSEPGTTTSTTVASTAVGTPPSTTVSGPLRLTVGQFTGIDHDASGTAGVYEQEGEFVLRFEDDTQIQNGPDLYVWLLAADEFDGGNPTDYLDLGTLKGTVGGQNYDLPPEFDPEIHRAVLIWCLRFAVPFAIAPLN
jgi:hypothetical protein